MAQGPSPRGLLGAWGPLRGPRPMLLHLPRVSQHLWGRCPHRGCPEGACAAPGARKNPGSEQNVIKMLADPRCSCCLSPLRIAQGRRLRAVGVTTSPQSPAQVPPRRQRRQRVGTSPRGHRPRVGCLPLGEMLGHQEVVAGFNKTPPREPWGTCGPLGSVDAPVFCKSFWHYGWNMI